jgi:hypothetical protein
MHVRYRIALLVLLLLPGIAVSASAQSNFSFRIGAAALVEDNGKTHYGPNVGFGGKFNITDLIRVRGQFDVDRVLLTDVVLPDFQGEQTQTYVCLGAGLELGLGTDVINFILNVVPHGTIRTNVRTVTHDDGTLGVRSLTRFSLGMIAGAGGEVYVTNNIGFEGLFQYVIFNFDTIEVEPINTGYRATLGMQFYLGRNYVRPETTQ